MDGRGHWRDNVFVERLWRSVKYEEVYLKAYDSVSAARADIAALPRLLQRAPPAPRPSAGRRRTGVLRLAAAAEGGGLSDEHGLPTAPLASGLQAAGAPPWTTLRSDFKPQPIHLSLPGSCSNKRSHF